MSVSSPPLGLDLNFFPSFFFPPPLFGLLALPNCRVSPLPFVLRASLFFPPLFLNPFFQAPPPRSVLEPPVLKIFFPLRPAKMRLIFPLWRPSCPQSPSTFAVCREPLLNAFQHSLLPSRPLRTNFFPSWPFFSLKGFFRCLFLPLDLFLSVCFFSFFNCFFGPAEFNDRTFFYKQPSFLLALFPSFRVVYQFLLEFFSRDSPPPVSLLIRFFLVHFPPPPLRIFAFFRGFFSLELSSTDPPPTDPPTPGGAIDKVNVSLFLFAVGWIPFQTRPSRRPLTF